MNTKHTPGKWAIRDNEIIGPYGTSKSICEMTGDFCTPEETKANKQLIAAAPELLAALIEAKKLLESVRHRLPKSIKNTETFHFENVLANSITKAIQNATNP